MSGKSWKIGKRVRGPDNRLRLKDLEIRKPGLEELNMVAQSNTEHDYEFTKVRLFKISDFISDNDVYATQSGEIQKIKNLAFQIKQNRWFEPVIVGMQPGYTPELWEGQHRTRALKLLGFNLVPGLELK